MLHLIVMDCSKFLIFLILPVLSSRTEIPNTCKASGLINHLNVGTFKNCVHLEGDIYISNSSFVGMAPEALKVLQSIKTVKGAITITAHHPRFTNLSFLQNLEVVIGRTTWNTEYCIGIENTSLKSLEFRSLKEIKCKILIKDNENLCDLFSNSTRIDRNVIPKFLIENNKNNSECQCNGECTSHGCWGRGPDQCIKCKNYIFDSNCEQCPEDKCLHNSECKDCNSVTDIEDRMSNKSALACSVGEYKILDGCQPCDEQCKSECDGPTAKNCTECKHVKDGDVCSSACATSKYNIDGECFDCHKACIDGCTGSKSIYDVGGCLGKDPQRELIELLLIVIFLLVLVLTLTGALFFRYYKNRRYKSALNLNEEEMALNHNPSYIQSETNDKRKFITIKETEVTRVKKMGQGGFGIVYQGIWTPEGSKRNITVAVKILLASPSTETSKNVLNEALIMTSLDHPNILQLLAICATTEIMFLTQLMPLGCILTYVRKKKGHITAKSLLSWSSQIAKGMAYLEERHVVHRDLAARNVLLESEHSIKISDFGLAQFMGSNELGNPNTKFPIKWLALECFTLRRCTHKSDVWAFGITVWELLTFGKRPFTGILHCDLEKQLKLGLKLTQPSNCSADVYVVLLSCWLLQPEHRPAFTELASSFDRFLGEPTRYIVSSSLGNKFEAEEPHSLIERVHRNSDSSSRNDSLGSHNDGENSLLTHSYSRPDQKSSVLTEDTSSYDAVVHFGPAPIKPKSAAQTQSENISPYDQSGYLIPRSDTYCSNELIRKPNDENKNVLIEILKSS